MRGGAMFICGTIGLGIDTVGAHVKLIADVFGQYRDDRRGLHDPELAARAE